MRRLQFNGPRKQRGQLFGLDLFGSESETQTQQTSTQTTDSVSTLTSLTESEQAGTSVTQILSPEVQAALESLVLDVAGTGDEQTGADQISSIAQLLFERAQTAADDIRASTDAIIADERRSAERELRAIETQIGQAGGGVGVGSSSFVAGATAEGRAALETGLARLEAELDIQARGIETGELVSAIQAFASGAGTSATQSNAVAQLVNVLRGATATTTTEQTGTEQVNAEETLNQIIESLTQGTSTTETSESLLSGLTGFF